MNKKFLLALCLGVCGVAQATTSVNIANHTAQSLYVRVKGRLVAGTGDKKADRRSIGYTIESGKTQNYDFGGDVRLIKVRIKPDDKPETEKLLSVKFSGKKVKVNPRPDLFNATAWVIENNQSGTRIAINPVH